MPPFKVAHATLALLAFGTAASARDGLPYVGIEGGVIKPEIIKLDYRLQTIDVPDGFAFKHRSGHDADLITGLDLGVLRLEGELAHKRASLEDVAVLPAVFPTSGLPAVTGRTRVLSAMANALLDLNVSDGLQLYGGGGLGAAKFKTDSSITGPSVPTGAGINGSDRSFAWQLIAGMRVPVNFNVDLGVKYRYFRSNLNFRDDNNGTAVETAKGRFASHSLLASVIVNIGKAPAPETAPAPMPVAEPAPPPPPATQTCPDGTVILASDACPVVSPPPPPPPAPERG